MKEQSTETRAGARSPAPEASAVHGRSRKQSQELVQRALQRATDAGARAVVAVVEINPDYAARAPQRAERVLAEWRRRFPERFDGVHAAMGSVIVVVAPVAAPSHGRTVAERFARSLDPRVCPLLARALPYAWSGFAVYPDDGIDSGTLIQRAEHALDAARAAGSPGRIRVAAARRRALAQVRGAVAAPSATVRP
jgi:hypothetical protein